MDPLPFHDARPLLDDPAALAARAAHDGYLFVPGLLPHDRVEPIARLVHAACERRGFTRPGAPPVTFQDAEWVSLQAELLPTAEVAALAAAPSLLDVLAATLGAPPVHHGGDVIRIGFPDAPAHTTPPHQDAFYLRDPSIWIAWIPLADCPLERGPLAVAPGSHRGGLRPHDAGDAYAPHAVLHDDDRWAASPLRPGDALLLSALTLHRALDNRSKALRLSIDLRFAPAKTAGP